MYVVVEFIDYTCFVVPYCWLHNENKKCYWPRTKIRDTFEKLVAKKMSPLNTWIVCDVRNVLFTSEDQAAADSHLEECLLESVTSDDGETIVRSIKPFTSDNGETIVRSIKPLLDNPILQDLNTSGKRQNVESSQLESRKKHKTQDDTRVIYSASEESEQSAKESEDNWDSSNDGQRSGSVPPSLQQNVPSQLVKLSESKSSKSHSKESTTRSIRLRNDDNEDGCSTPMSVTPTSSIMSNNVIKKLIDNQLHLKEVQSQQSITLNEILRYLKAQANLGVAPVDIPEYPVDSREDFRKSEEFISKQENFEYLKKRLAAVGGTTVRNAVHSMLKFLITNKVAKKFNWLGHNNKKSFSNTNLLKVIREAVWLQFESSTENIIKAAIQDWLKQAKKRYNDSLKRQTV